MRASQRARLLEAIAAATAEKGYAAVTIGDIVERAGVARRTFYEHFADKQECYLIGMDECARDLLGTITAAFDPDATLPGITQNGIREFLRWLAARPAVAWAYLVEADAAGPAARAQRLERHRLFADSLVELSRRLPGAEPLTGMHALAVVGAVAELVYRAVHERGPRRLEELGDELAPLAGSLLRAHPVAHDRGGRRVPATRPGARGRR